MAVLSLGTNTIHTQTPQAWTARCQGNATWLPGRLVPCNFARSLHIPACSHVSLLEAEHAQVSAACS